MQRILIKIKGVTPLMHHRMDEETLFSLIKTTANGKGKGDKKTTSENVTPRDIAAKHAYKMGKVFVIPTSYIIGAFREVASEYKQKNSQRKSMKSIAGGILRPEQEYIPLTWDGSSIEDFEVDIRKATNHLKGAVAVCRPRFDLWETEGVFVADTDLITPDMLHEMLNDAGKRSGIGSFRVSKGGYFGQFQIKEFTLLDN